MSTIGWACPRSGSLALLVPWFVLLVPAPAKGQIRTSEAVGEAHVFELEVGASNFDNVIGQVAYRYIWPWQLELGLRLSGARSREAYFAGYGVDDAASAEARGQLFVPLLRSRPLSLQARLEAGTRLGWSRDESLLARGAPGDRVTAITGSAGMRAHVRTGGWIVHTGASVPISYQIQPEGQLDVIGGVIESGLARRVGDALWVTTSVDVGGIFGSDGDAGKMLVRGLVGARAVIGDSTNGDQAKPGATLETPDVSPFVHSGWRVSGQADHFSHGPALEMGVLVLRHLKLGIATHMRPGPMNPKTFEVTLANGQSYKGQDTVALRSDGNFLGLLVAPILDLPRSRLQLEAPIAIGQGVYGFYLSGDDRMTPDGRRVSKWEDELQSGKDSGFAVGIDAGLRVGYKVAPWSRVVVGAHYTKLFGYEAFVTDDYSGPSVSLGMELGAFE